MHPSFEHLTQVHGQLLRLQLAYFNHEVLFSFDWWFLVVTSIAGWLAFIWLVDRRRISRIIFFGTIVLAITTVLDGIGTEFQLWYYRIMLGPLFFRFLPVDFCAMPITFMLVYQYARSWRSFLITSAVVSLVFAFGFEPLLEWMDIYRPRLWHHVYSVPAYFAVAVGTRVFIEWLEREERKAAGPSQR